MKNEKLVEATMRALRGKLSEVKGSSKTYTCIEDRQGGDFAVGKTMTAEEWGEEAYSWAYGDDWTDPEEPLLRNFKTEQECLDFIQDMWEITIVPSDSPEAKEFLKEDNDVEIPADLQDYVNSWKEKVGGDVKSIKYLGGTSTPNDMVKINNVMYEFNRSTKKLVRKVPASFTDKKEARSHKEDNERVAPRDRTQNWQGGVNKLSNKAVGMAIGDEDRVATEKGVVQVGKDRGAVIDRDIKRNRVRGAEQALNRKNAGDLDFAGTSDLQNYEVSPNQKSREYRKAHGMITRENKKVTEATTDVNEVVDEYKEAYHKDLDLKTVPCVIARDKMLSGWGGAEGRNHYQVVLCADSTEAHNIANNMQAQAKREQLANVRVSFGVKLPSRASVAYCVGRNASAWNMSGSWYERYDTEKKTEAIDENLKAYTVTVSDEENQHSFQFYAEKDKTLDDVFNEIYDYVIF